MNIDPEKVVLDIIEGMNQSATAAIESVNLRNQLSAVRPLFNQSADLPSFVNTILRLQWFFQWLATRVVNLFYDLAAIE